MSEAPASENQAAEDAAEDKEEKLILNRREFLNIAWLASLGILVAEVSGATLIFSYPIFREGEFGGIIPFKISQAPEQLDPPANFPKQKIWLSHTSTGLMAIFKICPHLGCLYAWNDQEFKFICPCHGSQYELDGEYSSGPTPRGLDYFAISIVDEQGNELASSNERGRVSLPDDPDAVVRVDTTNKTLGQVHD